MNCPALVYATDMSALAFWKAIVGDKSGFLERIIALLEENRLAYCVVGGVAVNAYAPSIVTQDLDLVLASSDLDRARELLGEQFEVREFEHSLNVSDPGSRLQVQLQKDLHLSDLLERARRMEVDDLLLPVAAPEDLVRLKIQAATDPALRNMKKGRDRMDLARLITVFPELRPLIPKELWPEVEGLLDEPLG